MSPYLQGFIHPRWCRISSINSITIPHYIFYIYHVSISGKHDRRSCLWSQLLTLMSCVHIQRWQWIVAYVWYCLVQFQTQDLDHPTKIRSQIIFVLPASYRIPLVWIHPIIKYNSCTFCVSASKNFETYCWWKKSQTTTWDVSQTQKDDGINDQPQLVIAGFVPSTVLRSRCCMSVVRMILRTHMHMYWPSAA